MTESKVYWVDCNFRYKGEPKDVIHYYSGSVKTFVNKYSAYPYMTTLHKTAAYKTAHIINPTKVSLNVKSKP